MDLSAGRTPVPVRAPGSPGRAAERACGLAARGRVSGVAGGAELTCGRAWGTAAARAAAEGQGR